MGICYDIVSDAAGEGLELGKGPWSEAVEALRSVDPVGEITALLVEAHEEPNVARGVAQRVAAFAAANPDWRILNDHQDDCILVVDDVEAERADLAREGFDPSEWRIYRRVGPVYEEENEGGAGASEETESSSAPCADFDGAREALEHLRASAPELNDLARLVAQSKARSPRLREPVYVVLRALQLAPGERREVRPSEVLRSRASRDAAGDVRFADFVEVPPASVTPFRATILLPWDSPPGTAWSEEAGICVSSAKFSAEEALATGAGPVPIWFFLHAQEGCCYPTARCAADVQVVLENRGAEAVDFAGCFSGYTLSDSE